MSRPEALFWEGAKGVPTKAKEKNLLKVKRKGKFRVFQGVLRLFSGVTRNFQGVFRVFSPSTLRISPSQMELSGIFLMVHETAGRFLRLFDVCVLSCACC